MQSTATILPASIRSTDLLGGKVLRIALGTVFLAASSWVSVPTLPIPITMQTYAVIVIGALFGARLGVITVMAWLAEAAIGMPVLAHGAGGLAVFLDPSVGYLASFPVAAGLVGWVSDRKLDQNIVSSFISMLMGNAVNLALGVLWLSAIVGWHRAVVVGFLPFWIGGFVKAFLATATVWCVRNGRSKLSSHV